MTRAAKTHFTVERVEISPAEAIGRGYYASATTRWEVLDAAGDYYGDHWSASAAHAEARRLRRAEAARHRKGWPTWAQVTRRCAVRVASAVWNAVYMLAVLAFLLFVLVAFAGNLAYFAGMIGHGQP